MHIINADQRPSLYMPYSPFQEMRQPPLKRRLPGSSPASWRQEALPLHNPRHLSTKSRLIRRYQSSPVNTFTRLVTFAIFLLCCTLFWVLWSGGKSLFHSSRNRTNNLPFYIPKPDPDVLDWEWPLVHIVNTRFMQEQGNLTELGKARLALFRVFCLPTMARQSTQKYLWIIKTDPNLDLDLLQDMVEALSPFPNFYLVSSNVNFRVNEQFPGAWRDGAEVQDLTRSKVYTGNQTLLERAMALHKTSDPYPVLETRLDADDGLHFQYLEAIQELAIDEFEGKENLKWMYWCSRRHVEWHFAEQEFDDKPIWKEITRYGAIAGIQHSKLCITPGITVGFPAGVAEKDVPIHPHDKLIERIRDMPKEEACGLSKSKECLQFVETFVFEAIRSRSPTSAGMLKIKVQPKEVATDGWLYFAFLDMVHEKFGITLQHLEWINQYFSDHLLEIAEENLRGQCTTGHSCKESARKSLEELISSRRNATRTG